MSTSTSPAPALRASATSTALVRYGHCYSTACTKALLLWAPVVPCARTPSVSLPFWTLSPLLWSGSRNPRHRIGLCRYGLGWAWTCTGDAA
ncbi:hypothetical protein HDV62DRAFT_43643 [Trichoderma sp. SZMC 28011]